MSRTFRVALGLLGLAFVGLGLLNWVVSRSEPSWGGEPRPTLVDRLTGQTETVERTDYHAPPPADPALDAFLADDTLDTKDPAFDPDRVDRRPLDGWLVNASAAVIRLDLPLVKPDATPEMTALYPSYAAAAAAAKGNRLLPSVNLIDGKAKQFDDGLYAALDQAHYLGRGESLASLTGLFRRLHDRLPKGSPAADYIAGGLSLAGESDPCRKDLDITPTARARAEAFQRQSAFARPIGFYTWTPTLGDVFRVLRYFAQPIRGREVIDAIAGVFRDDSALLGEYRRALAFYAGLTNPLVGASPADFVGPGPAPESGVPVALLPASSSRETELFKRLFPLGLPPGTDLMRTLVDAVRSGKVDLAPRPDGGWYDHQVYALETLLLPGRGEESKKLLLTKAYKKRMMEAFQALITKRRETHVRQLEIAFAPTAAMPRALTQVKPRLRLEPNPSYYLRTARSYAFLETFLVATVGEPTLRSLHGLREGGDRVPDLLGELRGMRDLFYGFHLLSAEDIGMAPALRPDEPVDRAACETAASAWLEHHRDDPDLAADTRVAVPVFLDATRNVTKVWVTLGVRLAPLEASYARGPRLRPEKPVTEPAKPGRDGQPVDPNAWAEVERHRLASAAHVIPVDEFAEVELPGLRVLTRAELRAICDQAKTRAAILQALQTP